ncbi:ribonuclease BN [Janibacter sp. Soil728]|uniref:YihY/virulence factor BrkB family protein n=1 Tax=Janibacter sp. Soil728 TaxID=1736393 RepID=UPI0006FB4358|nr:YihY/virulence factor BrkB family protein [Janibacter sp. Soil728]KRE37278.1 ribonuclease BN [Janibacter sp. Soil728]
MAARARRGDGTAPHPEESRKPDAPTDITRPTLRYVLRKTAREFSADECTDLAAALTYYAVLALFPAFIALMSLVGLVGQGPQTVETILGVVRDTAGASVADAIEPVMTSLSQTPGAGLALVLGLVGALWSASGYVNAFSRAMNRIYGFREGRPFWKLRPITLLVTLVLLVLVALVLVGLVVSGPVATSIGSALGLGSAAVTIWQIAKWPVLLAVVVLIVAILYYATPNVRQPRMRWMSPGALLAILVWVLASVVFGVYVASFGSYNKTYGSMAGIIVFLLWLWLTNVALLFGAELDTELERGRELQAGMPAEEEIQLPARDSRGIDKKREKHEADVREGRRLRNHSHRDPD